MANAHLNYPESVVNPTATPVSGGYLAHSHRSPIERAFTAADLYLGAIQLVLPTMTQATSLTRVNVTYGWWALKRRNERAAIQAGQVPLAPPRLAKMNGNTALLVPPASEIDDSTFISIARNVGADRMLAAAVAVEAAH
jgi:hypothetical protein